MKIISKTLFTIVFFTLSSASFSAPDNNQQQNQNVQLEIGAHLKQAIDNEMSSLNAMNCQVEDKACLSDELQERYRLDQWIREQFYSLDICGKYRESHKSNCERMLMGNIVFQIDIPNTSRLKQIIKVHGFPSTPDFSAETQLAAWYIVQHAQYITKAGSTAWDADLAESILPIVKKAIADGDLTPWHYATMYDRMSLTRGKPQRYATQITCENGIAKFSNLEDKERLNEYRESIGMKLFEQSAYDQYCAETHADK